MRESFCRQGKPFDSLRGKPGTSKERQKMHTIDTLAALLLASDKTATEEGVRAYLTRNIDILGIEETTKRQLARLEANAAKKPLRAPRDSGKPAMIRDSYKGRTFYRRADASELHDM